MKEKAIILPDKVMDWLDQNGERLAIALALSLLGMLGLLAVFLFTALIIFLFGWWTILVVTVFAVLATVIFNVIDV